MSAPNLNSSHKSEIPQSAFDHSGALTAEYLRSLGECCANKCKNCPYRTGREKISLAFFDVDGVLATGLDRDVHGFHSFSPKPVANLQRVIAAIPNLKIVFSSSWRYDVFRLAFTWFEAGLPKEVILGCTPHSWIVGKHTEPNWRPPQNGER